MWTMQKPRYVYALKEEQVGFGPDSAKPLPQVKSSYYEQIQWQENRLITWNSAQLVSVHSDILHVPGM